MTWKSRPSRVRREANKGTLSGSKDKISCYLKFLRPGSLFSFFSQASGSSHLSLVNCHQPFLHPLPYLERGLKESAACSLQAFTEWPQTGCAEQTWPSWGIHSSLRSPLVTEIGHLQLSVGLNLYLMPHFPFSNPLPPKSRFSDLDFEKGAFPFNILLCFM